MTDAQPRVDGLTPGDGRSVWQELRRPRINADDAAARTQAYILGNIAVLATLAIVGRDQQNLGQAVLLVVGTVLTTFAAHVVADAFAKRVRSGQRPDRQSLIHSARDSFPIISSGLIPVLALSLAAVDAVPFLVGYIVAIASVIARFLFLGRIIARLRGQPSSWRTRTAGVALASLGIVLAGVELLLIH